MNKISIEEMKDALMRSGYLLESRVLDFFFTEEFWAESNHRFFLGGDEDKYRELDVLASRYIDSIQIKSKAESVSLFLHFITECVNNPVPLALFTNVGDREEPTTDWSYMFTNGSEVLVEAASIHWPHSIYTFAPEIFSSIPSRQYCGFTEKKGNTKDKWMASHPDDFHQTLLKLVQFNKYKKKEIRAEREGIQPESCRLDVFIPLIVLQGDIVIVEAQNALDVTPSQYYRLKVPYESGYNKSISIDIVTETYLPEYFKKKMSGLILMFDDLKKELMKDFG
jgi:hypothetical protein